MKKVLAIMCLLVAALALPTVARASESGSEEINPKEIIFHHLGDVYGWEVPFSHENRIPLPIIVNDADGAWHVFSSARVQHSDFVDGNVTYRIAHGGDYSGKVVQIMPDGSEYRPLDLSITKNVCALLIAAALVALVTFLLVRFYKRNGKKAPRKGMGFFEMLVSFIYDGVIRDTLKDKAPRFAGYLLTVFFLIFFMNLLGLVVIFPGGANLTGNIAVTMTLAICTFLITNIKGNKHYWKDIFWPNVPLFLKAYPVPLMPVIEFFGVFTKPFALMVRLFANMMAGHAIILSFTCVIFLGWSMGVGYGMGLNFISVIMMLFMNCLEVLVAFIQAYVFTLLSAVFIGLAHKEEEAE